MAHPAHPGRCASQGINTPAHQGVTLIRGHLRHVRKAPVSKAPVELAEVRTFWEERLPVPNCSPLPPPLLPPSWRL